jgi:uncharacterized protein (TIGR02246 family)
MDDDLRRVRDVSDRLTQAEVDGDADAFLALLADDAVIMAPWQPPLEGKGACAAFVRQLLPEVHAQYERDIRMDTAELRVIGDWAFERAIMSQTLTPRNGGGAVEHERYNVLFVFRRDPGGGWKGARAIFNLIDQSETAVAPAS